MVKHTLFQHLTLLATDRWARRGVRTLLRGAWFGASCYCIGLGGHLLWGWPLRLDILGVLALASVGVALMLLLRPRFTPAEAARRLDQRFHLHEQLATAVEVARSNPPPESIGGQLLAQAARTSGQLHDRIMQRQRPPWSEAITLAALGLVMLGLYVLIEIGQVAPLGPAVPLPPLTSASDPPPPFAEEPLAPGQQAQIGGPGGEQAASGDAAGTQAGAGQPGATSQQTLEALADALRDQGATRPASEALDRGDVPGAAQELRELADQASQLSQASRNDLADALRGAARQIEQDDPALAEQLRQSAEGLERGGQDAAQALDDLARAIERLPGDQQNPAGQDSQAGQEPGGQAGQEGQGAPAGEGAAPGAQGDIGAGEQRQTAQSERLGVEGQPVQLEAEGEGEIPTAPSDRPPTNASGAAGFTQGDGGSDQRVETGPDPLHIPLDERDVVQEYFQQS